MTELKLIDLHEEHRRRVVRVRHDLGQLLAAACMKRGLDEHDVLQISDQEAKSWIVEELETELPFWPQAIASDVLEETTGRRHRAPDVEEDAFAVWYPRAP